MVIVDEPDAEAMNIAQHIHNFFAHQAQID